MPEAEDLLIDAARHATVAVQGMWRRLRPPQRDGASYRQLADCRPRLALLVEAVLGMRLAVRNAQPPAPASWAARLLRREARRAPLALPANDGCAIYLPPRIAAAADGDHDYPLLALLQAVRVARGSAACYARCSTPLAADLFLLAEAVAAGRALHRLLPGWSAALDALYARSAGLAESLLPAGALHAEVLALYRHARHGAAVPPACTAQEALDWAQDHARALQRRAPRERYVHWLEDMVIGRMLPAEGMPSPLASPALRGAPEADGAPRRTALARRPRARRSEEGEDDGEPGVWMIQTTEPHEHAEDPLGLNRPQDRERDGDIEGAAQSLAELEAARLVSTPGRAAEVMCSDDPPPRLQREAEAGGGQGTYAYPEWDCRLGAYGAQAAQVHAAPASEGPEQWAAAALQRHAGTLRTLRRRLGVIRPHRQVLRRQPDGDDIDCDAAVDERCMRRAGASSPGAVYQQQRRAPRRIGLLLLIDASASTDAWVADGRRVIDVEKEAALVAAGALQMAGAEFAMLSFSGEGRSGIQVRAIKDFGQPWNDGTMRRLAGLEPERYTRLGGVVRHASALLARCAADLRLLLLFSDGKPNDCDLYAGGYGLEDARQALIEARAQHIDPYCFTVDREGAGYLPHLFGQGRYTIVQRAQQLPLAFVDWLRHAARRAGG